MFRLFRISKRGRSQLVAEREAASVVVYTAFNTGAAIPYQPAVSIELKTETGATYILQVPEDKINGLIARLQLAKANLSR